MTKEVPVIAVPVTRPADTTDAGVISPNVNVMAGIVVGLTTVPDTPLAVTTETAVTVPEPASEEFAQAEPLYESICPEEGLEMETSESPESAISSEIVTCS